MTMTYFGFLLRFLVPPLLILAGFYWWDQRSGRQLPNHMRTWGPLAVILAHVVVAVVYTTPWDNYLVATRVWWYDEALVTGIVWGWVPIEEYTFFVLQTLLTGFWVIFLARRLDLSLPFQPSVRLRWWGTAAVGLLWLISTILLLSGYRPATYMTLILSWALIPIIVQLALGADILWYYRKLLGWAIIPTTLYLAAADALAIDIGIWLISPEQTFGLKLGGILPIEEFTFFLITNVLVGFGVTLVLAVQSHYRVKPYLPALTRLPAGGHVKIKRDATSS